MHISSSHDFAASPVDLVDMLRAPDFWARVAERSGASAHTVLAAAGDVVVGMTLTAPAQVAKLIGAHLPLEQRLTLGAPDSAGVIPSTVDVDVKGLPVSMKAHGTLSPTARGSRMAYEGELSVRIPLLGKKLEAEATPMIEHALDIQAEVGRDWLAERHSAK